jgi:AraC-like DNA-binding protein
MLMSDPLECVTAGFAVVKKGFLCMICNQKFNKLCISYKMSDLKIDRLSALLEGLAPVVTLGLSTQRRLQGPSHPKDESTLQLYFLTCGGAELKVGHASHRVDAPALIAVHAAQSFVLHKFTADVPNRLIAAHVKLMGPVAALFLEEFEKPRTLSLANDEPALRLAVAMIESELNAPRCGQPALLNRAGDILFIGLLRSLVAHPIAKSGGLFNGLADPRIARALVAIHQRPSFGWTLERLAAEAGMSRTAFATKFHEIMRRPPGKYLAAIRLALAQRAVDLGKGLKEAARIAGYANTSALSRALAKSRLQPLS